MICPNQSNRGPLEEKKKENKCGSLPTADIVGAVGKMLGPNKKSLQPNVIDSIMYFSTGPDGVGRWQRATFFFFHIQGTSIGLVQTNHALLSLVDTNLVQSTCTCTSHSRRTCQLPFMCAAVVVQRQLRTHVHQTSRQCT